VEEEDDAMTGLLTGAWAERALLVVLLWALGGRVGLLIGAVIAGYDAARLPRPRELLLGSLALFALAPLAVLARGLPERATIGPDIATGNLVAHYLAGTALALLVLGVLRDVRDGVRDEQAMAANGTAERALVPRPAPPAGDADR
jgi:ABC-type glycerol-3-phosphate transport system permease component